MVAIRSGLLARPAVRLGIAALVVGEAVVIAAIYAVEKAGLKAREHDVTFAKRMPGPQFRPNAADPLRTPPAVKAEAAGLDPSEEVIGVTVSGKARAYRLDALRDRDRHVVNDLVADTPVSVTYCDLSDCVRVYTDVTRGEPLDLRTAGVLGPEMVVKVGDDLYFQSSGLMMESAQPKRLPYANLKPVRTTWGEWLGRHPDTDVFLGVPKYRPRD